MEFGNLNSLASILPLFILSALLIIAAYIDLRSNKIPNILTFPGMLMALFYFSTANGLDGLLFSLKGIGLGIGLLFIPYLIGGMGAGDAKFMGAVGGFLGAKGVFGAFIFTAIVGAIYALLVSFFFQKRFAGCFKDLWKRWIFFLSTKKFLASAEDKESQKPRLCYGLAIALGTASYMTVKAFGFNIF